MYDSFKTNEFSEDSKIDNDSELNVNNVNQKDNNVKIKEGKFSDENNVNTEENKNDIKSDEWMIRTCQLYNEEYNDCMSIKSRFHQHFVSGEFANCSQWKIDFKNCLKWEKDKDTEAFDAIVKSETTRRKNRLMAHYANNVWKKRDKPPENWAKPLPEWLQKRNENSYLELKSQKMKSGSVSDYETHIPVCSIL